MAEALKTHNRVGVERIYGVFIKANNPSLLAGWYTEHFGLNFQNSDCGEGDNYWCEFGKPSDGDAPQPVTGIFAIQSAKSPLPAERREVVINYLVSNLESFLAQLKAGGVQINKAEDYPYGRFAWITDLEGNHIELYQPL